MSAPDVVTIEGPFWTAQLAPELGGALTRVCGRLGADWHEVTRTADPAAIARRDVLGLAGFVLAPFCNRLDGGRFVHDGDVVRVPLNWPADPSVAIHGVSWQTPFEVDQRAPDSVMLVQDVARPDCDFRFEARLSYAVADHAFRATLTVRNTGPRTLPFGLGFHPYFRATPACRVAFEAGGWLEPDDRLLPRRWHPLAGADRYREGIEAAELSGTDALFAPWHRSAAIAWPELGARLRLSASETAAGLHLFAPAHPAQFVCLEPVSHVIDVHNRRHLATAGDATPLPPDAELAMSMTWTLEPSA